MPKEGCGTRQDLGSVLTGPFFTSREASPPITGSIKVEECEEIKISQVRSLQRFRHLTPRAFKNTTEVK